MRIYGDLSIRIAHKLRAILAPNAIARSGFKAFVTNETLHRRLKNPEDRDANIVAWLQYLQPGDTIFDIGGNVGHVACMMAQHLSGECKIYSVEPNPENVVIIMDNVRRNGWYKSIFPICGALSERTHLAKIGLARLNMNTMDQGFQLEIRGNYEAFVPVMTLDELSSSISPPNHIKIDVDGAELSVLEGGRESLSQVKSLNLEWRPSTKGMSEVIKSLEAYGLKRVWSKELSDDILEEIFVRA